MFDNYTKTFATIAVVLCFAAMIGGFTGFLAGIAFGGLAGAAGAVLDGKIDAPELNRKFNRGGRRR